jgi:hypothetical protein
LRAVSEHLDRAKQHIEDLEKEKLAADKSANRRIELLQEELGQVGTDDTLHRELRVEREKQTELSEKLRKANAHSYLMEEELEKAKIERDAVGP